MNFISRIFGKGPRNSVPQPTPGDTKTVDGFLFLFRTDLGLYGCEHGWVHATDEQVSFYKFSLRRLAASRKANAGFTLHESAVIAAILLALVFCARAAGSELDEYTRADRLQHAGAGLAIGAISAALVETLPATRDLPRWEKFLIALAPAVVAGLVKEAHDDHFDPRDAYATCFGGMAGASLTLVWRF